MNLRQQILRERAKSTADDSPMLASTPERLAIMAHPSQLNFVIADRHRSTCSRSASSRP
jgi:hypothetical protein